jgi:hypothetical protein
MEKEQPREASRAPSCSDVDSKIGAIAKRGVCVSMRVGFTMSPSLNAHWVRGTPKGGLEFWKGGYRGPDGEQGELVYKQPGTEVDDSCHS